MLFSRTQNIDRILTVDNIDNLLQKKYDLVTQHEF